MKNIRNFKKNTLRNDLSKDNSFVKIESIEKKGKYIQRPFSQQFRDINKNKIENNKSRQATSKLILDETKTLSQIIDNDDLNFINMINSRQSSPKEEIIENLNYDELERKLRLKEKILLKFKSNKDNLNNQLNTLLKKLNNLIENPNYQLHNSEAFKESGNLNMLIKNKENELASLKSYSNIYSSQITRMHTNNDKLKSVQEKEEKINSLKNENRLFTEKIKELKEVNKNVFKKIENYHQLPIKISLLTDEMKGLVSRKQESIQKLNSMKKYLINVQDYLQKTKSEFNEIINSKENKNVLNKEDKYVIESYFSLIEDEIIGDPDEILNKIDSEILKINFLSKNSSSDSSSSMKKTKSKSPFKFSNSFIQEKIDETEKEKKRKLFSSKNLTRNLNSRKQKKSDEITENISRFQETINELIQEEELTKREEEELLRTEPQIDYENINEIEFKCLIEKKDSLISLNKKILNNIKDNEKYYDNKIKMQEKDTINNQYNLNILIEINNEIRTEIEELLDILSLNKSTLQIINETNTLNHTIISNLNQKT